MLHDSLPKIEPADDACVCPCPCAHLCRAHTSQASTPPPMRRHVLKPSGGLCSHPPWDRAAAGPPGQLLSPAPRVPMAEGLRLAVSALAQKWQMSWHPGLHGPTSHQPHLSVGGGEAGLPQGVPEGRNRKPLVSNVSDYQEPIWPAHATPTALTLALSSSSRRLQPPAAQPSLSFQASAFSEAEWGRYLKGGGTQVGPHGNSINPPSEILTQSIWGAGRHHNTVIRNNFPLSASFEDCNCN